MGSPYSDLTRPPLRAASLTRALVRHGSPWHEVRVLDEVTSTNAVAEQAAANGVAEGLVVVAEHQTEGRGRQGRAWLSPPRAGLTFSVLFRPAVAGQRVTWLPLLTGLAVADALEQTTEVVAQLKWPNDLLVGGRKLGGILAARRADAVILGVGINVTTSAEELRDAGATSLLLEDAVTTDRETLLRACLRSLASAYTAWSRDQSDDELAARYAVRCATLGSDVWVQLPGGAVLEGRADRVDGEGRLVVANTDGEQAISSGDVVHVRMTDPTA